MKGKKLNYDGQESQDKVEFAVKDDLTGELGQWSRVYRWYAISYKHGRGSRRYM